MVEILLQKQSEMSDNLAMFYEAILELFPFVHHLSVHVYTLDVPIMPNNGKFEDMILYV